MNVFDLQEQVIHSPQTGSECSVQDNRAPVVQSTTSAARRVEPAINHMLAHLNEPIRISSLSRISGVSKSHFFTLFKLATGSSPNQFLIRLRMRRACELLSKSDAIVKEVAHEMGYDDPFYFSRIFKLVTGLSPKNYRESLGLVSGRDPATMEFLRNIT